MNVRNFVTFLTLLFLPAVAFAFGNDASIKARAEIITAVSDLIYVVSFLIGLILLVTGGYKLKLISDENQKGNKYGAPAMAILAGVIIMNCSESLSVLGATYLNAEKFCMIVADGSISDSCMNTELVGVTGELKSRIEKLSSGSTAEAFMDNIRIIIGIFQIIGLIYFLVGAYGLYEVANGSSKENGYGKPIITMFASALIVDIPHTIQIALDTLEKIGINF
ncbi:hypothetical protein N5J66_12660 [Pseudomonas juntendi]|uniref:hypothetical protein n=1 Tax=Pseudomonas TaxID=286 RepID=UPI001F3EC0C1|nr:MULTISPECIES: hypothetical protein [Pseudomonas]MDH2014814.1 hypothetical protein [Pseudomonas juntendi]HEJ6524389.1 hypothetical protein [Pseudomonas aeruginosa]